MRLDWVASKAESGTKLNAFLKSKLTEMSARQIKQLVDQGHCEINGKVERFSSRSVGTGDVIVLYRPKNTSPPELAFNSPSRLLYEDNEFIIYNKPAGLSSEDATLLSFIRGCSPAAQLVHRLDRNTTGVLIFAKNDNIAQEMLALFKKRQIKKTYLAMVDGIPKTSQGVIDNFLGKIAAYHGQALYGEVPQAKGGVPARTVWQKKKSGNGVSLLICFPETGRTHQLRVHLSSLGHPILGDHQYGRSFRCSWRPQRQLLHAYEINFENPATKKMVHVTAALPADFVEAELFLDSGRGRGGDA